LRHPACIGAHVSGALGIVMFLAENKRGVYCDHNPASLNENGKSPFDDGCGPCRQ
jgi:hypothetical protein